MNESHPNRLSCFFLDVNLEQTKDTFSTSIITGILNAAFSLITASGNFIILHVIWKKQELHSPSLILLACLASSDFLVGMICQPFYVAYQTAELVNNFDAYCVLRMIQNVSSYTTSGVSLAILGLVSFDRLLALTLHLRYDTIVTVCKIFQTVFFLWTSIATFVMSRLWIATSRWNFAPMILFLATFLVITLSTLKIFHIVRRHQRQINQQQQSVQLNTVNVLKCRKSAATVLYVYSLFLVFYIPFFVTMLVETSTGYTLTVKIAYDYVTTVVFINSFLNPFVYCWRIGEMRRAVKNVLRKLIKTPNRRCTVNILGNAFFKISS